MIAGAAVGGRAARHGGLSILGEVVENPNDGGAVQVGGRCLEAAWPRRIGSRARPRKRTARACRRGAALPTARSALRGSGPHGRPCAAPQAPLPCALRPGLYPLRRRRGSSARLPARLLAKSPSMSRAERAASCLRRCIARDSSCRRLRSLGRQGRAARRRRQGRLSSSGGHSRVSILRCVSFIDQLPFSAGPHRVRGPHADLASGPIETPCVVSSQ